MYLYGQFMIIVLLEVKRILGRGGKNLKIYEIKSLNQLCWLKFCNWVGVCVWWPHKRYPPSFFFFFFSFLFPLL